MKVKGLKCYVIESSADGDILEFGGTAIYTSKEEALLSLFVWETQYPTEAEKKKFTVKKSVVITDEVVKFIESSVEVRLNEIVNGFKKQG